MVELCRQWDLEELLGFCTADITLGLWRSQAHNTVLCLQLVALEKKKKRKSLQSLQRNLIFNLSVSIFMYLLLKY